MTPYRIALLWRGDREARQAATPHNNRYHRIFAELAALGVQAEPRLQSPASGSIACVPPAPGNRNES
ncbi:MAG: hypothetical protein JO058_17875 [Alphaproteobacteria bacterium]|nr:hypothetical protein [Alphaproteobacteria bacterium]